MSGDTKDILQLSVIGVMLLALGWLIGLASFPYMADLPNAKDIIRYQQNPPTGDCLIVSHPVYSASDGRLYYCRKPEWVQK